ncbi:MAG: L-threonylcarbamoyladenylate synthase [Oscillospiraceae bacterium]|nr:L-threonylcarbamoyladenylate synthase [Oscillospiraceae bacterium]
MDTIILNASELKNIKLCADVLKSGGLVAFPTETVYGLGANALDEIAVSRIFTTKGRQEDNPLIVHVASIDEVGSLVDSTPEVFLTLAKAFWPGALTLVMKKSKIIPDNVTAGLNTIAVRMPKHPAALALIRAFGFPVAAPSANPSGKPSPTKAIHVFNDINGKIPYILDGGDCEVGVESTVLDISGNTPRILRPGGVTYNEIKSVLRDMEVEIASSSMKITSETHETCIINKSNGTESPKSPGMKYRHYAPKAPITAVIGSPDKTAKHISDQINNSGGKDNRTAALMFDEYALSHPNVITFGKSDEYASQAARLFDALREFDNMDITSIYAQVPQEEDLGSTIANRIIKAAGGNLVILKM